MASIRIQKLTKRIKERAGEILLTEMNDPRLGFVTVTRVELANDLRHCTIYVSVFGTEGERSSVMRALNHAQGYIQGKIAQILHTRTTPFIQFKYDESIEGSVRISKLIDEISSERREREESGASEPPDDGPAPIDDQD